MTQSEKRHATLRDVAQHAGVSYQTVSRVINNDRYVATETRERVQASIAALDYHPSNLARGMRRQRSRTLAFLIDGLEQYGPWQLALHMQRAALERGYAMLLLQLDTSAHDHLEQAVALVRTWAVDGILGNLRTSDEPFEQLQRMLPSIPILRVGASSTLTPEGVITSTEHFSTRLAVDHVVALGHREIAAIVGPQSWYHGRERLTGYLEALAAHQLSLKAFVEGDWSAESGNAAARRLLEQQIHFTCLLVSNDAMALGAMRCLSEHGIRVPEDVSVVGFDNLPEAQYFSPPLTTVHLETTDNEAEQAIDKLVQMIEAGEQVNTTIFMKPRLVVRQSTRSLIVNPDTTGANR